jgi:uncharacterized membrane protein
MADTGHSSDTVPVFAGPSPRIQRIGMDRPWTWLARGWRDLWRAPAVSLAYGVIFSLAGLVIAAAIWLIDVFYLVLPLTAGFMLLGPILAVGLYEISRRLDRGEPVRRLDRGEPVSLGAALTAWRRNMAQIALMGLLLMLFLLAWIRIATLLFALFFADNPPDPNNFIAEVFFSLDSIPFLVTGTILGAILAGLAFALSAVSIPMLLDRDTNVVAAAATSFTAVRHNLPAMLFWGFLIVLFVGVGLVSFYVGLVVTLPLIGHATWHAYRDLVELSD